MIHFAICDDEPAQARLLSQLVSGWCAGQGEACQITCYPSAEALLFAWEDEPSADILLLDILMGQMNGMELARKLRQRRERLQILFITGTPDFVFAGYGVEAVSYLMKPVKEEELFRCLALAQSRLARQEPEVLVEAGDVCRRVPLAEISYLESFGHTTVLHTTRGDLESRKGIPGMGRRPGGRRLLPPPPVLSHLPGSCGCHYQNCCGDGFRDSPPHPPWEMGGRQPGLPGPVPG